MIKNYNMQGEHCFMKDFWNNYIVSFFSKYIDFDAVGKWILSMVPKQAGALLVFIVFGINEFIKNIALNNDLRLYLVEYGKLSVPFREKNLSLLFRAQFHV